jgi:hypothetical protein
MLTIGIGDQQLADPRFEHRLIWPRKSHFNPVRQYLDFGSRQAAARRHVNFAFVANDAGDQTCLGIATDRGRSGIAAAQNGLSGREPKFGLRLIVAVAFKASFDQQRPNVIFEERFVVLSASRACGDEQSE